MTQQPTMLRCLLLGLNLCSHIHTLSNNSTSSTIQFLNSHIAIHAMCNIRLQNRLQITNYNYLFMTERNAVRLSQVTFGKTRIASFVRVRNKPLNRQADSLIRYSYLFLAWLILRSCISSWHVLPKRRLISNGPEEVLSHNKEVYVTPALSTSFSACVRISKNHPTTNKLRRTSRQTLWCVGWCVATVFQVTDHRKYCCAPRRNNNFSYRFVLHVI
jgi:hypothetical protein